MRQPRTLMPAFPPGALHCPHLLFMHGHPSSFHLRHALPGHILRRRAVTGDICTPSIISVIAMFAAYFAAYFALRHDSLLLMSRYRSAPLNGTKYREAL